MDKSAWARRAAVLVVATGVLAVCEPIPDHGIAVAQSGARQMPPREKRSQPIVKPRAAPEAKPATAVPGPPDPAAPADVPDEAEKVEADVSARSVAIELGFTGTEIIVFGSVENSRQTSAESGYYDVVVTLEGQPTSLIVRRKTNVAGLWMNTPSQSFTFDRVPSYYAIASTRPIAEIAEPDVLSANAIGFEYVRIRPKEGRIRSIDPAVEKTYRDAVVRLKSYEGLYISAEYDVTFIGRSLFRTKIELPANIAVGPLDARVYLFREGKLLSQYTSKVTLEREGVELWLHGFAFRYPLLYGLFTVALAIGAGLLASTFFRGNAA